MVDGQDGERWWARWFETDFSWLGLGEQPIKRSGQHGEGTLQDYWRRDPSTGVFRDDDAMRAAGELVEFDNQLWHVVHLPVYGRTAGTASWKVEADHERWDVVAGLVRARLKAAVESRGTFTRLDVDGLAWRPEESDSRARLDGGVLGGVLAGALRPQRLDVCCRFAWFSAVRFQGWIGRGADFSDALFAGPVRLGHVIFADEVIFNRACFAGHASFEGSVFNGRARFHSVVFEGDLHLDDARFDQEARFRRASFHGAIGCAGGVFRGLADFEGARALGRVMVDATVFEGDASFASVTFSGGVNFIDTVFQGAVQFDGCAFKERFHASAEFMGAVSFRNAVFDGMLQFGGKIAAPELHCAGCFYGARFAALADFSGLGEDAGARLAVAFGEAHFEKGMILTDGSEDVALAAFARRIGGFRSTRSAGRGSGGGR